jgi:hypothetical protein
VARDLCIVGVNHRTAPVEVREKIAFEDQALPQALDDLKLAPFHLLATEGGVHTDKNHTWHMDTLAKVCREDAELMRATPYRLVDVTDPASEASGTDWWTKLTERGGEGIAVTSKKRIPGLEQFPPVDETVPAQYREPEGHWAAVALRSE